MRYPQPQCGSYTKNTGDDRNTAAAISIDDRDPTDTACINFDFEQADKWPMASTRSLMIDWRTVDLASRVSWRSRRSRKLIWVVRDQHIHLAKLREPDCRRLAATGVRLAVASKSVGRRLTQQWSARTTDVGAGDPHDLGCRWLCWPNMCAHTAVARR